MIDKDQEGTQQVPVQNADGQQAAERTSETSQNNEADAQREEKTQETKTEGSDAE